jgi:hypothetical protein
MFFLLPLFLLFTSHAVAKNDPGCSGDYSPYDPECGGVCSTQFCIDESDNGDGSQYQCCPPGAGTPELPIWFGPFLLATVFIGGYYFWHRRKVKLRLAVQKNKDQSIDPKTK